MRTGLLLLSIILLFGCVSQQLADARVQESLESTDKFDIDGDGEIDVWTYRFRSSEIGQTDILSGRTLIAYKTIDLAYSNFTHISDYSAIQLTQNLEDFRQEVEQSVDTCFRSIGLRGVSCIDAATCSKLCSLNSAACKKVATSNPDALGNSMIEYSKRSNDVSDALFDTGRSIINIIDSNDDETRTYTVKKTEEIMNSLYALEASTVIHDGTLALCEGSKYSPKKFKAFVDGIGESTKQTSGYKYAVVIELQPLPSATRTMLRSDIAISDVLPLGLVENGFESSFAFEQSLNGSGEVIAFEPIKKLPTDLQLFTYSFASAKTPDEVAASFSMPVLGMQLLDLSAFMPLDILFAVLGSILGNPHAALGLAVALIIIFLLVGASMLSLAFNIALAVARKETIAEGIRKSVSGTTVRWKTDLMLALIMGGIGLSIAYLFAAPAQGRPDIFTMSEIIITDPMSFIAASGVFFGVVLFYLSAENRIKVYLLESFYGKQLAVDKDAFQADVDELKQKWKELNDMIGQLNAENFDVGTEYDVATSLSEQRIIEIGKKFTEASAHNVQEHLVQVEDALERLAEKKRTAESGWKGWKLQIGTLLESSNKVNKAQLASVPPWARRWALSRYVKEHGGGLNFDGESLIPTEVSPVKVVDAMFDQGLLKGLLATKNDKVLIVRTAEGSKSVFGILGLKLLAYLKKATTGMGYDSYSTAASIGGESVIIISKDGGMDSLLLVPREKFKDALAAWKEKSGKVAQSE